MQLLIAELKLGGAIRFAHFASAAGQGKPIQRFGPMHAGDSTKPGGLIKSEVQANG
jgi:hypothetical protein